MRFIDFRQMEDNRRACVVLMCKILWDKNVYYRSVYDYKRAKYCSYSVNRSDNGTISIYDFDRGMLLYGNGGVFLDCNSSKYVILKRAGDFINGYDNKTGKYFVASIKGENVTIFDYENSCYFSYSVN